MIQIISKLISFGSVVVLVATVVLFVLLGAKRIWRQSVWLERSLSMIGRYSLWLVFFVSGSAILGSLFYSEVVGFAPCSLCWWQRIFLYPQALIVVFALWLRDRRFAPVYILWLSYIGCAVALYHTYLQYGGLPLVPCSANAVSCAQRFVFEFGFVTIPMMSLSVFVFIILTIHIGSLYNQKNI